MEKRHNSIYSKKMIESRRIEKWAIYLSPLLSKANQTCTVTFWIAKKKKEGKRNGSHVPQSIIIQSKQDLRSKRFYSKKMLQEEIKSQVLLYLNIQSKLDINCNPLDSKKKIARLKKEK